MNTASRNNLGNMYLQVRVKLFECCIIAALLFKIEALELNF